MITIYEQGDIFKYKDINYYMVSYIGNYKYQLISIIDGSNYDCDVCGDENYINNIIKSYNLEYIGNAKDIVNINKVKYTINDEIKQNIINKLEKLEYNDINKYENEFYINLDSSNYLMFSISSDYNLLVICSNGYNIISINTFDNLKYNNKYYNNIFEWVEKSIQ